MTDLSQTQHDDRLNAILRLLDRPIPASDLELNAQRAATAGPARGVKTTGLVMFRMGDEHLAVAATFLRRVTPYARPRPIPHVSNDIIRGLCNVRGELVLCADLRAVTGLPVGNDSHEKSDSTAETRRIVVIGPVEDTWAFEVDALIGIERVDTGQLRMPPITVQYALAAFTTGVTEIDGKQVTVLDGERILAGFRKGLP